jgi:DNA-binding MarR family transcriptional regulator
MTLGDLSRELELSHSTVSGIVDRLQAKEIVDRRPSPDDRRYVQISLTESVARRAPALANDGPIGRLEAVLKAATADERRRIKEGLGLLLRFADQASWYLRTCQPDIAYRVGKFRRCSDLGVFSDTFHFEISQGPWSSGGIRG